MDLTMLTRVRNIQIRKLDSMKSIFACTSLNMLKFFFFICMSLMLHKIYISDMV